MKRFLPLLFLLLLPLTAICQVQIYVPDLYFTTTTRLAGRTTAGAGSGELISVGSSLGLSGGVLDAVQDLRSTASPTFAGMSVGSSGMTVGIGGSASAAQDLNTNGSSAAGFGPRWLINRGGSNKAAIGTASAVIGGASNDLILYSIADNVTIYAAGSLAGTFATSGLSSPGFTLSGGGTGSVTASSGVFSITSDRRAKNEHGAYSRGLAEILQLPTVKYDFKNDPSHLLRVGFYTQDVEPLIPEAVFHDQAGGMASLDDRPILAAVVNSIKEQQASIVALQGRVAFLETHRADWFARFTFGLTIVFIVLLLQRLPKK